MSFLCMNLIDRDMFEISLYILSIQSLGMFFIYIFEMCLNFLCVLIYYTKYVYEICWVFPNPSVPLINFED